jgi:hypothetical protein
MNQYKLITTLGGTTIWLNVSVRLVGKKISSKKGMEDI